jgi:hypothetical protein
MKKRNCEEERRRMKKEGLKGIYSCSTVLKARFASGWANFASSSRKRRNKFLHSYRSGVKIVQERSIQNNQSNGSSALSMHNVLQEA